MVCVALLILTVPGCTGGAHTSLGSGTGVTPTHSGSRAAPGVRGCDPASPITLTPSRGPEVQGSGQDATFYGLIMTSKPMPIRAGENVKVVWRMTGSGPIRLSVIDPEGTPADLQWGPDFHGASNYQRPGEEWGAGYVFTTPGCWRLHAQRTTGSADVWLQVAPH